MANGYWWNERNEKLISSGFLNENNRPVRNYNTDINGWFHFDMTPLLSGAPFYYVTTILPGLQSCTTTVRTFFHTFTTQHIQLQVTQYRALYDSINCCPICYSQTGTMCDSYNNLTKNFCAMSQFCDNGRSNYNFYTLLPVQQSSRYVAKNFQRNWKDIRYADHQNITLLKNQRSHTIQNNSVLSKQNVLTKKETEIVSEKYLHTIFRESKMNETSETVDFDYENIFRILNDETESIKCEIKTHAGYSNPFHCKFCDKTNENKQTEIINHITLLESMNISPNEVTDSLRTFVLYTFSTKFFNKDHFIKMPHQSRYNNESVNCKKQYSSALLHLNGNLQSSMRYSSYLENQFQPIILRPNSIDNIENVLFTSSLLHRRKSAKNENKKVDCEAERKRDSLAQFVAIGPLNALWTIELQNGLWEKDRTRMQYTRNLIGNTKNMFETFNQPMTLIQTHAYIRFQHDIMMRKVH